MPVRSASAEWNGGLKDGRGSFQMESGISAKYSFTSRFGEGGASNPEELLAAAEAACYSMALSAALEKNGNKDTRVKADAKCTVEKVGDGFSITSIVLDVRVIAAGLDNAKLQQLAEDTKKGCPVSRALAGTKIEVKASLS
jgi:osmotically inducible protein OsmC